MLKFPVIPERRSNPSSSYLNHLTSSSNYSPTHSNQSSPRYALSPYTNHQQPRRFSLHVVLRKTSDHQQPTQTNLEDIIAKPDNYHIICKSANIKQDILLDTRESHNNITKSPYIPSNNAFNLDSFIKSSEGKTANTLSITKGISEYDAAALLADTAKLRRNTKTYKSRGISIFAPKQEKPTDQLQLQQKGSKESIASLLNCSFEKEFEGLNSSPSSEHDQSKLNSEEKLSLASAEDIPVSKKTVKEPSMVQIPLARIMRRRSCCCSDCGHLSEFEKKNQNLTNPTKREELNLLLAENARKEELILAQEKLRKEEEEDNSIEKEGNSDEKGLNEQVHTSLLKVVNVVLNTEEFPPQSTSLLTPQMVTDAGYETIRGSNNDETKRSNPLKDVKNKNQARRHQTSHSPQNYGIKLPKSGLIQNTFRSEITQSPLSIPFSGVMTRKGSTSSIMYTKADSPTTMYTEPQGDVLGGLQQKLQKLQITSRVKSTEEHEESKKKVEKMHTMSEAFLRKSEKTTTLPALPRLNKGVSMPKANTTIGKLSIQSIQGVYMNSSGNTTPKIYSVQQSPVNKASASGSMNFGKESSPRPKICIIASQNPEFKRRGSGTGYKLTEGKEEEVKRSSTKNCITTLETIDFMNGAHIKKDSLAIALQEKDEEYGKSEVYNKDAEKGGRPIKRTNRRKQKQGSQVEKRSLSMGMLLKAYQSTQVKNGMQTKKSVGV